MRCFNCNALECQFNVQQQMLLHCICLSTLFPCVWEQCIVPIQQLWGREKGLIMLVFIVNHLSIRIFRNPNSNIQIMFSLSSLLRQDHHRVSSYVDTSLLHHIFGLKWQSANIKRGEMLILVSPLYGRLAWLCTHPCYCWTSRNLLMNEVTPLKPWRGRLNTDRVSLPNFAQA